MGTKNDPGKFDCYGAAEPDEPMFVLLARDKHAPALVSLWAAMRELDGEDPVKVAEARECVYDMIDWAAARNKESVGLAQATVAGMLDLIRAANAGVRLAAIIDRGHEPKNNETSNAFIERVIAEIERANKS